MVVNINNLLVGLKSIDEKWKYPICDLFSGSPEAREKGHPTSLTCQYSAYPSSLPSHFIQMSDFAEWLPYSTFPSLGEGGTPLVELTGHGVEISRLFVKNESTNPTGSHKDRMSALSIARAIDVAAKGVVCSSSGNAALSAAAYAAFSGISCDIVVTPLLKNSYRLILERMGAVLHVVPSSLDRWEKVRDLVEHGYYPITNFSLPATGSCPYGVQGYKTIAYELWKQNKDAEVIIAPTARGDLIWGIYEGYMSLRDAGIIKNKIPRLVAVEPFARASLVIAGCADIRDKFVGTTSQFSTAGETTTDQVISAVKLSDGIVIVVNDEKSLQAQKDLAQKGIDLELCAASTFAAVKQLLNLNFISKNTQVVLIGTSSSAREAC